MSDLTTAIQEKYGEAARRAAAGGQASCGCACECSPTTGGADPITRDLYGADERNAVPDTALAASLGCGNPTALAQLAPGQVVLDLGSGGGIDVILSARRVGPTGKAYGLDMTDDMLALANANKQKAGIDNVEFLKGHIEAIPLPDNSVDVIISNCVINLSADKPQVFREAFRVLKPGGRLAVSDVVVRGDVPADIRRSVELWVGCVAGALQDTEYRAGLEGAGFTDVSIEPWRTYKVADAREFLEEAGIDTATLADQIDGKFASAFVRAVKPVSPVDIASGNRTCRACLPPCSTPGDRSADHADASDGTRAWLDRRGARTSPCGLVG